MKKYFLILFILLALTGQGCLDPDIDLAQGLADSSNAIIGKSIDLIINEPGIPRTTPKSYSKLISYATGGEIEFENLTLKIPAKALKIDTIVSITHFTDHRDKNIPLPVAASYTGYYLLEPENLLLLSPATLEIKADTSNVPDSDKAPNAALFRYDGQSWMQLTGTCSASKASANITSFSLFKLYGDLRESININQEKFEISKGFANLKVDLELEEFITPWGRDVEFGSSGAAFNMNTVNTGAMKYMLILREVKNDNSLEFIASRHLYLTGVNQLYWYNYIEDFKFNPQSWVVDKERFIPDQALFSIEDPDGIHSSTNLPEWHAAEIYFEGNNTPVTIYHERSAVSAPLYSTSKSLFRLPGLTRTFKEFFPLEKLSIYSKYIIEARWEFVHGTAFNPQGSAITPPFMLNDLSPEPIVSSSVSISSPSGTSADENERLYFEAQIDGNVTQEWKYMQWESSINGIFSSHNQFYYADLSPGQHIITLKIQLPDSTILEDVKYLNIEASTSENRPPVIISSPDTDTISDQLYYYDINAEDPENEDIYYYLLKGPSGVTVEQKSGLLSWTPGYIHIGSNAFTVEARDRWGEASSQSFSIMVTDPLNDTTPPSLTWVSPLNGETVEGIIDLYVSASDDRWMNQVKFHIITETGKLYAGSDNSVPYKVPLDTTGLADKEWEFQATAIDKVGNRTVKTIKVKVKN